MTRMLFTLTCLACLAVPTATAVGPAPRATGVMHDCNANGIEDAVDIATGISTDANLNGVPDECEQALARKPGIRDFLSAFRTPTHL